MDSRQLGTWNVLCARRANKSDWREGRRGNQSSKSLRYQTRRVPQESLLDAAVCLCGSRVCEANVFDLGCVLQLARTEFTSR